MIKLKRTKIIEKPRLKVRTAVVCVQCETLYSGRGDCPGCGSREVIPLSRWVTPMDRMVKVTRPMEVA